MFKKTMAVFVCSFIVLSNTYVLAAPSSWAKNEVSQALQDNLIPPELQNDYQNPITRIEFCKLAVAFYKTLNTPPANLQASPFIDTDDADVNTAYQLGIVTGTGENAFTPNGLVTRQEVCAMLTRAVATGMPTKKVATSYPCVFPDEAEIADWAITSIGFMSVNGAIFGDDMGNIMPQSYSTREQAILFCERLYETLYKESMKIFTNSIMPSTGNTVANIRAGAFAINIPDQGVYYRTNDGIVLVNENGQTIPILSEKVESMTITNNTIYFKKSSDKKVYLFDISTKQMEVLIDTPVTLFVQNGTNIYYISSQDNKLYSISIKDKAVQSFAYENVDFPIISATNIYYLSNGINVATNNSVEKIYDGEAQCLYLDNNNLFFINSEQIPYMINTNGGNLLKLSSIKAKQIVPSLTCVVILGQDGHVYRADLSGKGTAKIDDGVYDVLNSYDTIIYAKTAEGVIYSFKVDATEKTKISL